MVDVWCEARVGPIAADDTADVAAWRYQAEFIALSQLQADALATADQELAAAACTLARTVSPVDILRP
jgi:hypothetical protein